MMKQIQNSFLLHNNIINIHDNTLLVVFTRQPLKEKFLQSKLLMNLFDFLSN